MRAILFRRWMQKLWVLNVGATLIVSGENVRGKRGWVCLEGGKCRQICLEGVGEHNDNGGDKQNGGGEHKGADEHISGDKHNGGSDGYSKKKWADPI